MQYDFLKNFPKRMKSVGLHGMIIQNSSQKTTWKQYGIQSLEEQMNLIFAVLLFIMEQSLKEENCTMDDIGAYLDELLSRYMKKSFSFEECRKLGDFIVNVILCNEGRPMYFEGYDFEQEQYKKIHISYVANKIVYLDQDIRRTSYYLTDDGYNLLLSTLEVESNMKLTIHEMIFQMHLKKQNYDKAVDEIRNIFNLMRIQLQKIQEAMGRIKRNALEYSVKDYQQILKENLDTLSETKEKFQNYREMVKSRMRELEEQNISVRHLTEQEAGSLDSLRTIEQYLERTVDEHQKILSSHFDLKALYTRELELLSQMSMIQRFSFRGELYDKILKNPGALKNTDIFLKPLFNREPDKIYNLNKAFHYQKLSEKNKDEDTEEELDFDEEHFRKEKEKRQRQKLKKYENSLGFLLDTAKKTGETDLKNLADMIKKNPEDQEKLLPDVEIFKEIMVELIRTKEIDLDALKKERSQYIQDQTGDFQLNRMLLQLVEQIPDGEQIQRVEITRLEEKEPVLFQNIPDEQGEKRSVRCSNVRIRIIRNEEEML